jgi:uncharacterized protein YukE
MMPRIEVDTESLTAGGAQQSAAGGQALEAAGELRAAIAAAAAAVGDGGAGGAVGGWGDTWSLSLTALADATQRTGGNLAAAGRAYQETDESQMRT